jgi:hypothetical protein
MKSLLSFFYPLGQAGTVTDLHANAFVKNTGQLPPGRSTDAHASAGNFGRNKKGHLETGAPRLSCFSYFRRLMAIFLLLLLAGFPRLYAQPTIQ